MARITVEIETDSGSPADKRPLSFTLAGRTFLVRELLDRWHGAARAYFKLIRPAGHWVIHAEHRLMIEAFKRRDGEEAGRILQGHIRRTRLSLEARTDGVNGR